MLFPASRDAEDYRRARVCNTPRCRGALVSAWHGTANAYRVWCPTCGAENDSQFRRVGTRREAKEERIMGIKGLTDRGPMFPRIGTLRKGAPKPERGPGRDLKYFRFTSDDPAAEAAFKKAYPGEPNEVNIVLPFPTPEENLSAWREEWVAGGLVHRCDGEQCDIWRDVKGTYQRGNPSRPRACPGLADPPEKRRCKPVGRLNVVIPELERLAYVTVLTTSLHDIMTLQECLQAFYLLRQDLRGIPFILRRRPRKVSMPTNDGKRVRQEKWMLTIEPSPSWVSLQLAAMKRAAMPELPSAPLPALPAGDDEQDEDAIGVEPVAVTVTAPPSSAEFGDDPTDEIEPTEAPDLAQMPLDDLAKLYAGDDPKRQKKVVDWLRLHGVASPLDAEENDRRQFRDGLIDQIEKFGVGRKGQAA